MKFTDYFILEANKKEKSLIEQDDDIILGAELEFCMKDMKGHHSIAKFLKTKTSVDFDYSKDLSIKPNDENNDASIEIKTKPNPWNVFQEELEELLKLIQSYGYTNDTCGLHVTISHKNVEDLPKKFGYKMHLSMQDPKAHKYFPSRKDNFYTKSRSQKDTDYYEKYYSFRIREGTNQVEFRVIGGENYEYKWLQIRNLILDYMVNYKKSLLDSEFMKRKSLSIKSEKIKDPKFLYFHAKNVIKRRWSEAEPIIAKDFKYAYLYARDIIKDRWPEAEPFIKKDIQVAYLYARDIIKDRWLEVEPIILKDTKHSYFYARYVIKGRWPEAEPIIAKNTEFAYLYARYVIKDSWPEAEPVIMKNPEYAYYYAKYVIKGRWPEAEPIIKTNNFIANIYAQDIENEHL